MNRSVIAAVDDLFFAAKIRGTAEASGVKTIFPKTADAVCEEARRAGDALVLLDLHAKFCDPFALAARLKSDETTRDLPIVAFFSHVQTELMRRAKEAGVDQVLPRSVFTQRLPEILQITQQ
jgi:PleD family two-component response regulator